MLSDAQYSRGLSNSKVVCIKVNKAQSFRRPFPLNLTLSLIPISCDKLALAFSFNFLFLYIALWSTLYAGIYIFQTLSRFPAYQLPCFPVLLHLSTRDLRQTQPHFWRLKSPALTSSTVDIVPKAIQLPDLAGADPGSAQPDYLQSPATQMQRWPRSSAPRTSSQFITRQS